MKAKFLSIIAIAAAAFCSSCNMDLAPVGILEQNTAIQSVKDAESFRNSFYTGIRAFSSSQYFTYPEIQCDMFNGLTINGNRMGEIANGTVLSSDDNITGYWAAIYSLINNINFFIERCEPLLEKAKAENNLDDVADYELYLGEAHFFRGYYYAMLFDRWCVQYSPEIGDKPAMGLPIVTVYNPTADRTKYVGRSTMNETIQFFQKEIALGLEAISLYDEDHKANCKPMANYISHYAILAMQARIALWLGDYTTAIEKANEVINSKIYTLTSRDKYEDMWVNDMSNEIIFMPFESTSELGNAIGAAWISSLNTQADYVPAPKLLNALQEGYSALSKAGDIRLQAFVGTRTLATAYGNVNTACFVKFPGNPALQQTTVPNLVNIPKTFRLSELYLILAEASYMVGDEATADETIQLIKKNRNNNIKIESLSGQALLDEIRNQRCLELVGEGFRLSDLRRWHQGFTRSGDYSGVRLKGVDKNKIADILTPAGLNVTYEPDDHRYTWPIPSDEFDVNPQMKGQQNPGY